MSAEKYGWAIQKGEFFNNYIKVFLDSKYRIQEKVITVPKKTLHLVLTYLEPLSLISTLG